jgi:hypothetical protein
MELTGLDKAQLFFLMRMMSFMGTDYGLRLAVVVQTLLRQVQTELTGPVEVLLFLLTE